MFGRLLCLLGIHDHTLEHYHSSWFMLLCSRCRKHVYYYQILDQCYLPIRGEFTLKPGLTPPYPWPQIRRPVSFGSTPLIVPLPPCPSPSKVYIDKYGDKFGDGTYQETWINSTNPPIKEGIVLRPSTLR